MPSDAARSNQGNECIVHISVEGSKQEPKHPNFHSTLIHAFMMQKLKIFSAAFLSTQLVT